MGQRRAGLDGGLSGFGHGSPANKRILANFTRNLEDLMPSDIYQSVPRPGLPELAFPAAALDGRCIEAGMSDR